MEAPERGQVWRNKKTRREAFVCSVNENPIFGMTFKYRRPNPNSRATQMTTCRRMTVPVSVRRFLECFERVVGERVTFKESP